MPEEKLNKLYTECIQELESIGLNIQNKEIMGTIDIKISARNNKRYGCCKQENPDQNYKVIQKVGRHKIIKYEKFNVHHIEISKWVMQLNNSIIKNTIMHEIIHCIPFCNNHGKEFKKYANYINTKLGYDITTKGNKEADYIASNIEFKEENNYKYKIVCQNCGQTIYRKRFNKNLIKKYRCGICGGKLTLL